MPKGPNGQKRPDEVIGAARRVTVFDIFGSDLDDAVFDGVFETDRRRGRPV